jgi:hypothetical protein
MNRQNKTIQINLKIFKLVPNLVISAIVVAVVIGFALAVPLSSSSLPDFLSGVKSRVVGADGKPPRKTKTTSSTGTLPRESGQQRPRGECDAPMLLEEGQGYAVMESPSALRRAGSDDDKDDPFAAATPQQAAPRNDADATLRRLALKRHRDLLDSAFLKAITVNAHAHTVPEDNTGLPAVSWASLADRVQRTLWLLFDVLRTAALILVVYAFARDYFEHPPQLQGPYEPTDEEPADEEPADEEEQDDEASPAERDGDIDESPAELPAAAAAAYGPNAYSRSRSGGNNDDAGFVSVGPFTYLPCDCDAVRPPMRCFFCRILFAPREDDEPTGLEWGRRRRRRKDDGQ